MLFRSPRFPNLLARVLAVNRHTGKQVWETRIKGGALAGAYFVNLFFDRGYVLAAAGGHLYGLDAATGRIKWENPLKGCGFGIATLAAVTGSSGNAAGASCQMNQDAASTTAATAAA